MRRFGLAMLLLLIVAAHTMEAVAAGGSAPQPTASFFAFDPAFTGGVTTAVCGPDAIGRLWVVTATATGGGVVRLFVGIPQGLSMDLVQAAEWMPYGGWGGGVTVGCSLHSLKTHTEVFTTTGAGPGGGPHVIVWRLVY